MTSLKNTKPNPTIMDNEKEIFTDSEILSMKTSLWFIMKKTDTNTDEVLLFLKDLLQCEFS